MNRSALQIHDASLNLVVEGELKAASPGYALLARDPVLVGEAAQHLARLEPIAIDSRLWSELSQEPLRLRSAGGRSHADLAYLHLKSILDSVTPRPDELVCVAPATMDEQQLALLLSIVHECGVRVGGIVDTAVAAASAWPETGRLIHIDVHLHQSVVSAVEVREEARLERCERVPQVGLNGLYDSWMRLIAQRFVTHTRFDPLHQAASEQALFDALPAWLEQLMAQSSIEIELAVGEEVHRVRLSREELAIDAQPHYDRILARLHRLRHAGEYTTLALSEHAARLPGLRERLADLGNCTLVRFPVAAPALAAAELWIDKDTSGEEGVTLLRRVGRLSGEAAARLMPQPFEQEQSPSAELAPTHVLYRGQAHALKQEPLLVGLARLAGARQLTIQGAAAGISRVHCSLVRTGEGGEVIDHSRFGTWVNDEIVRGRARLRAGDRLRLGNPGVTLELIALD